MGPYFVGFSYCFWQSTSDDLVLVDPKLSYKSCILSVYQLIHLLSCFSELEACHSVGRQRNVNLIGPFGPALATAYSWYWSMFATDNLQSGPRFWRRRSIDSANVVQWHRHIDYGSPGIDDRKPFWEAQSSCRRPSVIFPNQVCHPIPRNLPVLWSSASPRRILTHASIQILGFFRALHLGQTSPSPHCGCQHGPNMICEDRRPTLTVSWLNRQRRQTPISLRARALFRSSSVRGRRSFFPTCAFGSSLCLTTRSDG